ncbi:MAG: chemotaxis protein CheW [Candidatus Margulisbacteria bacterium]|nr:chemotaxis protein CheW [Candidatus Margulisiibacteriota bacterium]
MTPNEEKQLKVEEVQLVVFRLRDEEFGLPINQVTRIVRVPEITKVPEAPGFIEGVINLRGDVIAVIDLARQFELPAIAERPASSRIIVAEIGGKPIGLLVDEVPELVRIAKDDIDPPPEILQTKVKKEFISGVGKLKERLLILIEADKLLEPNEVKQLTQIKEGGTQ